jgi:hypothetical protein
MWNWWRRFGGDAKGAFRSGGVEPTDRTALHPKVPVIPAKAGISRRFREIPAFAGMTGGVRIAGARDHAARFERESLYRFSGTLR